MVQYSPVVPREPTAKGKQARQWMGQRKLQMNPVATKDYRKRMQIDLESATGLMCLAFV